MRAFRSSDHSSGGEDLTASQSTPSSLETLRPGLHHVAHRDRHEYVRDGAEGRALETARRNTEDRHRLPVDDEGLADNIGASAETVLPIGVRQNGDEVAADDTIVVGSNQAAEGRFLPA